MSQLIDTLLSLPAILIAISMHEWAHGYAAYRLGDPTARNLGRLSLNPMRHIDPIGAICMLLFHFGWAKPVPINSRYFKKPSRDMALVAVAGPGMNIVLSFFSYFIFRLLYSLCPLHLVFESAGATILYFLVIIFQYLFIMNIGLAIFNLIPIPPLDGSRLLYLVVPQKYHTKLYQLERYSFLILIIILLLGSRFSFISTIIGWFAWLFEKAIGWLPFL